MKPTKKDLKKLLERIEGQKDDWARDSQAVGFNQGLETALRLVNELIEKLDE